jgi:hypothetical protein
VKKSTVVPALAATLIIGGGSAFAATGTPHAFGNGGKQYQFDATCHRITFVPPGITNHEAINVLSQQVKCLVRRQSDAGGGQGAVGVCLDGRPDKRGYQDIKVCQVGDTGYVGSLTAPAS